MESKDQSIPSDSPKNQEHELVLSDNEQRMFVDILMNPPKPNEALRAAAQNFERQMGLARKVMRENIDVLLDLAK